MKQILIFILSLLLISTLFAQENEKTLTKEEIGKASYSIGFDLGSNMKKQNLELLIEMLKKGLEDGYNENAPAISQKERDDVIMKYYSVKREAEKSVADVEADKNLKAAQEFLELNKTKEGIKVTPSGLQYRVLQSGHGPSPLPTDEVEVHYRGTMLDGSEFDSSFKRNKTMKFVVNQVVPGWQEALPMMKVGDKWQLFIPPQLGYGNRKHPVIPRNSALIFEVELISITGK